MEEIIRKRRSNRFVVFPALLFVIFLAFIFKLLNDPVFVTVFSVFLIPYLIYIVHTLIIPKDLIKLIDTKLVLTHPHREFKLTDCDEVSFFRPYASKWFYRGIFSSNKKGWETVIFHMKDGNNIGQEYVANGYNVAETIMQKLAHVTGSAQ